MKSNPFVNAFFRSTGLDLHSRDSFGRFIYYGDDDFLDGLDPNRPRSVEDDLTDEW